MKLMRDCSYRRVIRYSKRWLDVLDAIQVLGTPRFVSGNQVHRAHIGKLAQKRFLELYILGLEPIDGWRVPNGSSAYDNLLHSCAIRFPELICKANRLG